jgi:hypothetical protein
MVDPRGFPAESGIEVRRKDRLFKFQTSCTFEEAQKRSFWGIHDSTLGKTPHKTEMRSFIIASFPLLIIRHLVVFATASSSSTSSTTSPLTATTCSKMAPKIKLTYFAIEGAAECV